MQLDHASRRALKWVCIRSSVLVLGWGVPWIGVSAERFITKLAVGFFIGSILATSFAMLYKERLQSQHFTLWDEALFYSTLCLFLNIMRVFVVPTSGG